MILIDRELSHKKWEEGSCSVLSVRARGSGGEGMMDTPVTIPNTEVKHHNGEDSTAVRK